MNRLLLGITGLVALLVINATIATAENQGPANIDIYGGKSGKVPFPHAQHQKQLKDCNVCHRVFPQKTDAIKMGKEKGELKPKKVMNLQCIKCHKQEKRAGKAHGPVTCKSCHVK